MKKILLLLILLSIFIGLKIDVYAKTYSDEFYISDVIDGIYYAKEKNGKVEYRKAKFKRRSSDNKIVYCIEPFVNLTENKKYTGYDYNYEKLLNLSKEEWERVSLLAYYGYGYEDHTESKWYPITQILIWETIDKEAKFYYTKSFKGTKITKFTKEIDELEQLVENHNKIPSFSDTTQNMSINSTLTLEDTNQILNNFEVENEDNIAIEIKDNKLFITSSNKKQESNINLIRRDKQYNTPPVIYVSNTSQNVLLVGSHETIKTSLKVNIDSGEIKIIKKDADTNDIIPQGEATLVGTTYELYDGNNNYVDEIIINENSEGILTNLKYGNYRLIEKISGKGYKLDHKEYYFNINEENKYINLELANEVIKSKIKITKYITDNNKQELEKNITFQIINNKNELYKEIKTDEFGTVEFELPYGTYTIKQINTTEGYYKVDDFIVTIDENTEEVIEYFLHDLKVPDTNQKDYTNKTLTFLLTSITILGFKLKNEKENN